MDLVTRQTIYILDARLIEQPKYGNPDETQEKLRLTRVVLEPSTNAVRPRSLRDVYYSEGVVKRIRSAFAKVGAKLPDKLEITNEPISELTGLVLDVELKDIDWGNQMISREVIFPIEVRDDFEITPEIESQIDTMIIEREEARAAAQAGETTSTPRGSVEAWVPTPEETTAIDRLVDKIPGPTSQAEIKEVFQANREELSSIKRQILDGSLLSYLVADGRLEIA